MSSPLTTLFDHDRDRPSILAIVWLHTPNITRPERLQRDCVLIHEKITDAIGPYALQEGDVIYVGQGTGGMIRGLMLHQVNHPCRRIQVRMKPFQLRGSGWVVTVESDPACTPPPKKAESIKKPKPGGKTPEVIEKPEIAKAPAINKKPKPDSIKTAEVAPKPESIKKPEVATKAAKEFVERAEVDGDNDGSMRGPNNGASDLVVRWHEYEGEMFAFQLASDCDFAKARAKAKRLEEEGLSALVLQRRGLWVTMAGKFDSRAAAEAHFEAAKGVLGEDGYVRAFGKFCSKHKKVGDAAYVCESLAPTGRACG